MSISNSQANKLVIQDVLDNTTNITSNTSNITSNTSNITSNASNITSNLTKITNQENKLIETLPILPTTTYDVLQSQFSNTVDTGKQLKSPIEFGTVTSYFNSQQGVGINNKLRGNIRRFRILKNGFHNVVYDSKNDSNFQSEYKGINDHYSTSITYPAFSRWDKLLFDVTGDFDTTKTDNAIFYLENNYRLLMQIRSISGNDEEMNIFMHHDIIGGADGLNFASFISTMGSNNLPKIKRGVNTRFIFELDYSQDSKLRVNYYHLPVQSEVIPIPKHVEFYDSKQTYLSRTNDDVKIGTNSFQIEADVLWAGYSPDDNNVPNDTMFSSSVYLGTDNLCNFWVSINKINNQGFIRVLLTNSLGFRQLIMNSPILENKQFHFKVAFDRTPLLVAAIPPPFAKIFINDVEQTLTFSQNGGLSNTFPLSEIHQRNTLFVGIHPPNTPGTSTNTAFRGRLSNFKFTIGTNLVENASFEPTTLSDLQSKFTLNKLSNTTWDPIVS